MKNITLAILFVMATACSGCATLWNDTPPDVVDILLLSKDFWTVEKSTGDRRIPSPKMAVVEFDVEFIDQSQVTTKKIAEKVTDFGAGMKIALAGILYNSFVETLPEFEGRPLPLNEVGGSEAYSKLKGTSFSQMPTHEAQSDTDDTVRYTVDGLLALDKDQKDTTEILRELLQEVGADVALQVHLRVGVYDGRAVFVKGSSFEVTTATGTGRIVSSLSLLSASTVVDASSTGDAEAVNSLQFVKTVKRLFLPYIAMAIIATNL